MKKNRSHYLYASLFTLLTVFSGSSLAEQPATAMDILAGHFSREGNNGPAARETNNNIYIKFYTQQWIALLYVPFAYATTLNANTINTVLDSVERKSESGSFTRSKFGVLDEAATVHVEKYEIVEGQIQFQCGSLNPCAIRLYDNYLELVKSGIINEHIIKFDHVVK